MQYTLINPIIPGFSATEQILYNRGIAKNDMNRYINATWDEVADFSQFPMDIMKKAASAIITAIQKEKPMQVIVDCDCDGYTSAALFINYLYDIFPAYVNNNLVWFLHDAKIHGMSDFPDPDDLAEYLPKPGIIICPDSSSNDYKIHERFYSRGWDIVVLDHHEAEKISEQAYVINNQLCDYPNKEMSGVGVVWQFCRYLDNLLEKDNANKYLDLVALGMMADMMSLTSIETKFLINEGFKNLNNPFIVYMADKNSFKLTEHITPMGAAFYLAPFVNAVVRSGTEAEQEIIFQSMLSFKAYEYVLSTKRGHKSDEQEQLVLQAVRTATNVKNRQTKSEAAAIPFLDAKIAEGNLLQHKVILILLENGQINRNIAGLIANKIVPKYQRPCCILTKMPNGNYAGSARGYEAGGVTDFRQICIDTECATFAEG